MGNRSVLSVVTVAIFVTSIFSVPKYTKMEDKTNMFADSEPELLVFTGSSSGHVNGSKIEWTSRNC